MKLGQVGTLFGYLVAGLSGLGLAVFLASQFVEKGLTQQDNPPPSVAVPSSLETDGDVDISKEAVQIPDNPPVEPVAEPAQPQVQAPKVNSYGATQPFLEPFIYDDAGRRDPFVKYKELDPMVNNAMAGPLLPLQRYDLEQLKLVGVIWNVKNPKAMISDPNNQIHVLGKDDRIGRNNGYIAVIREGELVVVETVSVRGTLTYQTRVLELVQ